jgi:hypothetical protein
VLRLLDFGAIVQILPGKDGLLHISQIANERVNQVSDYLKEGQAVRVKVLEADEKGRVRLSMKAAAEAGPGASSKPPPGNKKGRFGVLFYCAAGPAYLATCFSRSSSSVLQSMHIVAVGRASRRFRPISTPQESQ